MASARALVRRALPAPVKRSIRTGRRAATRGQHWVRVVMDREIDRYLLELDPPRRDAVEISGNGRSHLPWRTFTSTAYPEFDLLAPHDIGRFDVVICEQVLEHVPEPWVATRALAGLCRPGGHVVVSTPFLLRLHPNPIDNWRFTPSGLRELLSSAGLEVVAVGSWGNRWCIRRNFARWAVFRPWHRMLARWTLRNEPLFPQVVWAFAVASREEATEREAEEQKDPGGPRLTPSIVSGPEVGRSPS
jgi:SAM-dependent methyltransferase